MPYIKPDRRLALTLCADASARAVLDVRGDIAGNFNFLISRIVWTLLEQNKNYQRINELIGVLECAKLELYRRQAAPYEDIKLEENGDVLDD